MKFKKSQINPETNMPFIVNEKATQVLNLRLTPDYKSAIKKLSLKNNRSMTNIALKIFDYFFDHAVPNYFFDDLDQYNTKKEASKSSRPRNRSK